MVTLTERSRATLQTLLCLVIALGWRVHLSGIYYGWEEGDYGNVMMVREVLDSGFTWFRTSHMPGWYSLAAVLRAMSDDARASALAMTLFFSLLNVGVGTLLARKLLGNGAAWLVGLWLALQPEMALYGSSTQRSPNFTSMAFLGMAFLIWGQQRSGFAATAAAFLVRMEGFFTLYLPALWSWTRDRGEGFRWTSLLLPVSILSGVVLGWQAYITQVHGEGFFVLGPLGINLSGESDGEAFEVGSWLVSGLAIIWDLLRWTLPRKLGGAWIILTLLGTVALARRIGRPGSRVLLVYAGFGLSFWLGEALLAQHHVNPQAELIEPCGILDPEHNLYWVWLLHAIPFLALVAGAGWTFVERRMTHLPSFVRNAVLAGVILSALPSFLNETTLQIERSARWYRPQLDLSTWLETETPPGTGILTSSIPEVWLKRSDLKPEASCDPDGDGRTYCWRRTDTGQRVYSWWTLPTSRGEMVPSEVVAGSEEAESFPREEDFLLFLQREEIRYLIFFEEEWTDARRFASFLESGTDVQQGGMNFTMLDADPPMAACGYGWRLFGVSPVGEPTPPSPPSFGSGIQGKGWGTPAASRP